MDRVQVESSNIRAIGFDLTTQTLEVEFISGAVYRYSGVPKEAHAQLMEANSKGQYLNARIKGIYPFVQVS